MPTLSLFGKEIPAVVLAGVLVLAGAGAAAGAAASGNISGEASTQVEQSLVLGDAFDDGVDAPAGSVTQVNDDGTSFRTGFEINQGEEAEVRIDVDNNADTELPSKLVVETEGPLHVDAEATNNAGGDIEIQRVGPNEFIINAPADIDSNTVDITVSAPNDAQPGFYETEVMLQPVEV